jgi:hypothetical protein
MGEMTNAYKILIGKREGKKALGRPRRRCEGVDWIHLPGRPRRRWEGIIKIDVGKVGCEDDWIHVDGRILLK